MASEVITINMAYQNGKLVENEVPGTLVFPPGRKPYFVPDVPTEWKPGRFRRKSTETDELGTLYMYECLDFMPWYYAVKLVPGVVWENEAEQVVNQGGCIYSAQPDDRANGGY